MKALIIEEDKKVISSLFSALRDACFVVDVATDLKEGQYLCFTGEYDLVIIDSILGQAATKEICINIRRDGKTVPLFILLEAGREADKIEFLDAGADDCLVKPFSIEELLARTKALLRRPRFFVGEILAFDDLVIDTARHRISRGKKNIILTRKEYMLLEFLLRNKGAVLSRAKIMEHVWDMNADPFSNTIESHILNLRRKIDVRNARKLIHTVPGRGYKMDYSR